MATDPPVLRIRRATIQDLDDVLAIENVSFPTPWAPESMADELRRGRSALYLAAEAAGVLIGYAGAWVYAGEAHIMNVAVAPHRRRQGIGEALLLELLWRAAEAGAEMAYLEARPTNSSAVALYAKLGFEPVGRRPRYYRDTGEDAVLMALLALDAEWRERLAERRRTWESRHGVRLEAD